jgi:DNA-binding XRE family transcriptional regulator
VGPGLTPAVSGEWAGAAHGRPELAAATVHVAHLLPPAGSERRSVGAGTLSVGYGINTEHPVGCLAVAARDREFEKQVAEVFGKRVRELRLEKGMTQEQLAEASGLHPTFISNVERGYRVPTLTTLYRLARGLDVDACGLLDHSGSRGAN